MSSEFNQKVNDAELEAVLQNFRTSVHAWSDQQSGRVRTIDPATQPSWWARMRGPIAGWTLACAVLTAGVSVPVSVHQQHKAATERALALEQQHQREVQQARARANAISDEQLFDFVDKDIAQAAPDALEPLANLMNESVTR